MYGQTEATARISYLAPDDIDKKRFGTLRKIFGSRNTMLAWGEFGFSAKCDIFDESRYKSLKSI